MDGRKPPDRALEQKVLVQDKSELLCWAQEWRLFRSLPTPAQNRSPSSHLSLMSSALCPLKGWKPALCGDAGLQGEAWPDRPRDALRLRLLSRPRFLSPPPRLTRRRSRRPAGGGWLSSSPSSCRRVIWRGKLIVWEVGWWVLSKCTLNTALSHIHSAWAALTRSLIRHKR